MAENVIIHEISLSGYKATSDGMLDLGTWGSYGVEKLHCTFDEAWRELTITAFFNVKGEVVGKALVGKDGYADVPWEATKENTFAGRIVFEGSMDGQRRITTDLNFKVTNHSSIADVDSVPTDDRWNQFVTQNKEYRDGAYEAATKAEARAEDAAAASEDAQAAMRAAKASENAAAASENAAKNSEDKAKASADAAARSETNASASERAAAGSAAAAAASEGSAAESAKNAASAAKKAADESVAANIATLKQIQSDVTEKQNNAATSANAAADAEQGALAAQAAAETAVTNAGTAATRAETAAGTATAAATNAGNSADAAAQSKAAAETAAQAAKEAQAAAAAARADAVKAQTAAQAAAKTAQDAQSAAEKARDDAQTAQQGAEAARDAAAGSAEAAAKSEENAKQSADTLAESVENVAANTAAVKELKEKKAEIDDSAVGADAWSSKHIIDKLCPKIEESGNPVQCYPVAGYPLGVTASWEPVQEGEGAPYPAGGGKNLLNFPENTVLKGTGDTELEFAFDLNGSYVFSFDANVKIVEIGSALWMFEVDGEQKYIVADSGTKSLALSGHITKVALTNWGRCTGTILWAQLEKGSTTTAYAPYENIRPIKGRDSVTVERCGETLWSLDEITVNEYNTNISARIDMDAINRLPRNVTLAFVGKCSNGNLKEIRFYSEEMKEIGTLRANGGLSTVLAAGTIAKVYLYAGLNASGERTCTNLQIVLGTKSPAVYEPYQGDTLNLTLPETIYGGSVDAVSGSGERARRMLPLDGTENWFTWGVNANNAAVTGFFTYDIADYKVENEEGICSHLLRQSGDTWGGRNEGIGFASVGSSRYLMCCVKTKILDDVSSDANAITSWKAYLAAQYAAGTPVQVCYKLATPVPFTATGGAALPALAGANTVMTDAESVAVTGRADPIKRIADLEAAVASIE